MCAPGLVGCSEPGDLPVLGVPPAQFRRVLRGSLLLFLLPVSVHAHPTPTHPPADMGRKLGTLHLSSTPSCALPLLLGEWGPWSWCFVLPLGEVAGVSGAAGQGLLEACQRPNESLGYSGSGAGMGPANHGWVGKEDRLTPSLLGCSRGQPPWERQRRLVTSLEGSHPATPS